MSLTYNQPALASVEQPRDIIEVLRRILERKHGRLVSYGEAEEVGDSLLSFYEVLATVVRTASSEA